MKVYRVWYWDPCNGMNSRSEDKGIFATLDAAQTYVNERIGEPGSTRRKDNWDHDAYRIQTIEVHE
jgi:hypothetical protein